MKTLYEFSKNNINYYNNLQSQIDNNEIPITEELLVKNHGKSIDSVLYKLNLCSYRSSQSNFIFENADDALFTIDEQYAARDILLFTCKSYVESICEEYNLEIPILEGENNTINSLKAFINKVQTVAKEKSEQFKDKLSEVKDRLKAIYDFVKQVASKAIKSAKELAQKFLDLMTSIKDTLGQLFEKLGGKIEEIQKEYQDRISEVINNKSARPKDNIYETLQNRIIDESINEEEIYEFLGFGKKKNQDNEESKSDDKSKNEYDKSIEKGDGTEDSKTKKIAKGGGKLILSILKQIAISVTILIIIPALIGCTWGPAAAMIAATVAKAMMTGYGFYKLGKNIYTTISTGKFKEASKWGKLGYIFLWVLSIMLLAWGAKKAGEDVIKCWKAFSDGNLKQLVPDETIQGAMKLINKIWKAITGQDTPGVEELNKLTSNGIVEWEKLEETKETTINNGSTEDRVKAIQKAADDYNGKNSMELVNQAKEIAKGSGLNADNVNPDTVYKVWVDGSLENLKNQLSKSGLSGENLDKAMSFLNKSLNNANANAGSGTFADLTGDAIKALAGKGVLGANGHYGILGASTETITQTVTKMIPHHLPLISGGFAPIVALPTIFKKKVNKGFLLRLGSSRSGNNIYTIKEDGIKGMKFSELESKYGDQNKPVIDNMKKIINKNYKTLENAKEKLEEKGNLDKSEKKLLDAMTKQIEKMKSGIDEYECLVFYSSTVVEATEPQEENSETNEGFIDKLFNKGDKPESKEIEYAPVMFVNPLCMACGDLADSTKKRGPRKKPIYIKGLFASYEFLPGSEGMNEKDLDQLLTSIATECLKTAWNMTADSPCIKKKLKNKYIENEESIYKDQERDDFGKFTNKEITEIFNDPSSISKYMSGKFSKTSTVEKENTESQKVRKENAKKEWKDNIENNEEVKEIINKSKSLKKNLLDDEGHVKDDALNDLSDAFLRMETSYNKGKSKKSLWKKIKNFFTGDDDKSDKYDPEEVQTLAYKLASLHSKKLKSKKSKNNEESNDDLNESIKYFDMNMEDLLSEEFLYFIENNQIFESNIDDYIKLFEE